ncbi:hypothetical protein [Nocardia sp. NBC_00416]|uniref:hypothetical protein n=1 Tax=Nocardia sp. NBC_00416 TaxID=2975991 RepID=UPI002E1E628A
MTIICSACSWPAPALISEHGPVRYWRCVCGQWLVSEEATVTAAPGGNDFAPTPAPCGRPRSGADDVRRVDIPGHV